MRVVVLDPTTGQPMGSEAVPIRVANPDGTPIGAGGGGGGAVTVADGADIALGVTTAAEAAGNGSLIAVVKRLRTLLNGGLPAALTAGGNLKVAVQEALPAGTNNVGDFDIASMPAAGENDYLSAMPASHAIMVGTTGTPATPVLAIPKFFSETVVPSDTDEELVALVAGKKIRVVALVAQCGATGTTMTFESSTTTRKHKIPAGVNGGQVLPFNPAGWFETAAGESLTVTTGAGSDCEISGVYVEV